MMLLLISGKRTAPEAASTAQLMKGNWMGRCNLVRCLKHRLSAATCV